MPTTETYHPDENTNGSFAVIYRRSVFKQLIDEIEKMDSPFDAGPLRKIALGTSKGKSYVAFPNIVIAHLEKPGIRESRNQLEFSKRFGWNLDDFPPWFSSWSNSPIVLANSCNPPEKGKLVFVTAVTTINRIKYLQNFVSDWRMTKSRDVESILVVADDGSTDGTIEWLTEELEFENSGLVVIRNNGRGIARQTNSILDFISNLDYSVDSIFMCNDDIRFLKSKWDMEYFEAMQSSGLDHLVYFNPQWKAHL